MKMIQWFRGPSRKRGIALIVVVGALALTTVLLIAMFSVTEAEYRATQSFVAAQSAKQYADMAVSIVQAQIQNAQNDPTDSSKWTATNRTTHSTQPGVATVFNSSGAFLRAHKLYSSSNMVANPPLSNLVKGMDNSGKLLVPPDWNNPANKGYRARYVDMNEPVVRASLSSTPGARAIYFPVIDPRAAYNFAESKQATPGWEPDYGTKTTKVEGFSYVAGPGAATPTSSGSESYTGWASGAASFDGVVTPSAGVDPNQLRLPMPVEWMYVLKDGTFGTLDANGVFVPAPNGSAPTAENPIVSRMAFWTDDESCKININTASEPTFSNTPFYFHDRDRLWAHYPGSTGEYQRYPGHPATVALSAVLYPAHRLDAYAAGTGKDKDGLTKAEIVNLKNAIYDIAPKINHGGSLSGTVPFVVDEINGFKDASLAKNVDLINAASERLYATVDEMIFKDDVFAAGTGRAASLITSPDGRKLFDHDTLERTRFFLTANSRAPEFSIHGLPRIAMWPIADESKGAAWRTNFDNMIALCATLKKVPGGAGGGSGAFTYYFRRFEPHHSTKDVELPRNLKLLSYIENQLTNLKYPQTGGGTGSNFKEKYGEDNVRQLAVEIFDYIRCTNLYDGVQARWNNGEIQAADNNAVNGSFANRYNWAADRALNRFTYTNQRATPSWSDKGEGVGVIKDAQRTSDDTSVLPGHGTVTPAAWKKDGKTYMGFGRFFTVSEIGLHFICTADGATDDFSVGPNNKKFGGTFSKASGGKSAVRVLQSEDTQGITQYPGDLGGGNLANYKPLIPAVDGPAYLKNCNVDQDKTARWWSNFPPLNPPEGPPEAWKKDGVKDILTEYYGCDLSKPADPTNNPAHPSYHPGLWAENWNTTLAYNTPLEPDERRIQANIDLESFCAMAGWTKFYPEFTIVVDGNFIGQIKVKNSDGKDARLFNTTGDLPLKSNGNFYEAAGTHSCGGHATPAALASGRASNAYGVDGDGRPCKDLSDPNYENPVGLRKGLVNYPFAGNFITVKRNKAMELTFPLGGLLKIRIYDSHDWENRQPVQIINVKFAKSASLPTPVLAAPRGEENNFRIIENATNGTKSYRRGLQGPHWWVTNDLGCLGRYAGALPNAAWSSTAPGGVTFWPGNAAPQNVLATAIKQETRGRLHSQIAVLGAAAGGFDTSNAGGAGGAVRGEPDDFSDTVRTLVPAVGDYRMIAALNGGSTGTPETLWVQHPMWKEQESKPYDQQVRTVHSYTGQYGNIEAGVRLAVNPATGAPGTDISPSVAPTADPKLALVSGAYAAGSNNNVDRQPDLPGQIGWATTANSFGDFDTTISAGREGPYINKPDEGNFYAGNDTRTVAGSSQTRFYRSGYFRDGSGLGVRQTDDWRNGVYMTPNRMVSSPVMFGSLPTGVWNTGGTVPASFYAISGSFGTETAIRADSFPSRPWQTLLFRPHSAKTQTGSSVAGKANHPGQLNPMDHYILDLFFMPVVEPYAISEPLSVAGRINLNYQMLPFTNIRRATGLHALMKGEFLTAIPNTIGTRPGVVALKTNKGFHNTLWDTFLNETPQVTGDAEDKVYVHRPINVSETLIQFDERFKLDQNVPGASQGPFRSASQICEVHLIPGMGQGETGASPSSPSALRNMTASGNVRKSKMDKFWENNPATGDNVRERPYSNLYSRTTTRTNTFRVHVRAQVIKKARSVEPTRFDPDKDAVLSEYRGSTLLERYIDPNDTTSPLPDYAATSNPIAVAPLDTFYKFRALESKRFNP